MRRTRTVRSLGLALALTGASVSCGDVVRQGDAPVYLVVDSLTGQRGGTGTPSNVLISDVITLVTSPAPCTSASPCPTIFNDLGTVSFSLLPKDVTTAGTPFEPSSNSSVTITRYRVTYRRADGRNTPGVDVPFPFDGAATGTVPYGGNLSLGFELVRHIAKQESPLVQLSTSPTTITTIAEVTFFGRDQVGNDISATGLIQVDFGNFGD
jgi:hypothetical protein